MINLKTELLPPLELVCDGSSTIEEYISVGEGLFGYLKMQLPLSAEASVMEVGSCVGRFSRHFAATLSAGGRYIGFDLLEPQIRWCRENIGAGRPNFTFIQADLYNKTYNPSGTVQAADYRFPAADASVDLVFLASVFTHMLLPDLDHYVDEIRRVLKPDGHCFSTFFLFDDDEYPRVSSVDAAVKFSFPLHYGPPEQRPVALCANENTPEDAVCWDKDFMVGLHREKGLSLYKDLPGNWLKRSSPYAPFQDILIFCKN